MRIPIYWTAYHLAEAPLSETEFLTAHLYPGRVRRAYWLSLLKQGIVPFLRIVALFLMLVIADDYFRGDAPHDSGLATTALVLGGCWVMLSVALSTLSFAGYVISTAAFWERQIREARHHDDYTDFRHALIHGRRSENESWTPVLGVGLLCMAAFGVFAVFMHVGAPGPAASSGAPAARQITPGAANAVRERTPTPSASRRSENSASDQIDPTHRDSASCLDAAAGAECLEPVVQAASLTSDEKRKQQLPGAKAFHRFEPGTMVLSTNPLDRQLWHGIDEAIAEAHDLMRDYQLPGSLTIDARECRTGGLYEAGTRHIAVCAPYVRRLYSEGLRDRPAVNALGDARDAARFVIAHEIGHALIDSYHLPVLGREEDAADQFATFLFLEHDRPLPVLAMIIHYLRVRDRQVTDEEFGDAHAVGPQRLANLECWLSGSDTTEFTVIGENLPRNRRAACPAEYDRLRASWSASLKGYLSR